MGTGDWEDDSPRAINIEASVRPLTHASTSLRKISRLSKSLPGLARRGVMRVERASRRLQISP